MIGTKDGGSVLIVTSAQSSFVTLKGILHSTFSSIQYADTMMKAKQTVSAGNIDYMVINTPLTDEFGLQSALDIVKIRPVYVILIVKAEQYDQVYSKVKGTGIMVITRPLKGQAILEAARILQTMHDKLEEAYEANRKLKKRLEEIGVVTRAKCLLIERKGMSEEDAHHYLEREAMNSGSSKKEIAQSVIREFEL